MIDDCKRCKFACKDRDFYTYGEIKFCRPQMMWLIDKLLEGEFDEGNWPTNPKGSSYVDPSLRSKSFRNEAYFCKPVELVAEVMTRLRKAKQDGQTLMEEIQSGLHEYSLLSRAAKNALNYISIYDWRKRKTSYGQWKASLNYYKNIKTKKKGGE